MADVLTPAQRRHCMSRVKSKNTKPELRLRRALWAAGMRYRVHYKLFGKPDLVFPTARLVVFVDGCFWHGCPMHATHPKTNAGFWAGKLRENMERDERVNGRLRELGWRVLRVWQHDVQGDLPNVVERVRNALAE